MVSTLAPMIETIRNTKKGLVFFGSEAAFRRLILKQSIVSPVYRCKAEGSPVLGNDSRLIHQRLSPRTKRSLLRCMSNDRCRF
jgi:hypothetical protein